MEPSHVSGSNPRRGLLLGLAAAGAAGLAAGGVAADPAPPTLAQWPSLRLLDGSTLVPSRWQGDAVVLVVWATHCPFCLRHNAHVEKLHRASAGSPLHVVTAALDRDPDAVRAYQRKHGYTFPVTLDAEPLRAALGLRKVIPMTCTFDRGGRLVQRIPGEMFEEDVLELRRLART